MSGAPHTQPGRLPAQSRGSRSGINRGQQGSQGGVQHGGAGPGAGPGLPPIRVSTNQSENTMYDQLQTGAPHHQQHAPSQYIQNSGLGNDPLEDYNNFTATQALHGDAANNPYDANLGLLNWDWGDVNFDPNTAFGDSYEPQGELLQLFEDQQFRQPIKQQPAKQEFNLPNQDTVVQTTPQPAPQSNVLPNTVSGLPTVVPRAQPAPAQSSVRAGMKRKSQSEPSSAVEGQQVSSAGTTDKDHSPPSKRFAKPSPASTTDSSVKEGQSGETSGKEESASAARLVSRGNDTPSSTRQPETQSTAPRPKPTISQTREDRQTRSAIPGVMRAAVGDPRRSSGRSSLPQEKVFPIQIGSELFRLSGASIASDVFEEQLRNHEDDAGGVRTLYIDRDPVTFRDILLHLQGYYVYPKDGLHFVRLFADAQFYSLPRLISQLFESEIYMHIGEQPFRISRDIFSSPGDSPNFFTLGFHIFFTTPKEVFPGLDGRGLLRPPAIMPPSVPHRSADVFRDLLHVLRGYPIHIKNEEHRAELLRDCRYYHLRGLEQKLISHHISYNLRRQRSEIVIRLEDIRQSGITFVPDSHSVSAQTPDTPSRPVPPCPSGWVQYARPFVDNGPHDLILELSAAECHTLDLTDHRASFHGDAKKRITALFQVVANKMNLPTTQPLGLMLLSTGGGVAAQPASPGNTPLSEERVRIRIDPDADVIVDGVPYHGFSNTREPEASGSSDPDAEQQPPGPSRRSSEAGLSQHSDGPSPAARTSRSRWPSGKTIAGAEDGGEWVVQRGQWRLRVQSTPDGKGAEVVLVAVKLEVVTNEKARNKGRGFLG